MSFIEVKDDGSGSGTKADHVISWITTASIPTLFFQTGFPECHTTNSVKSKNIFISSNTNILSYSCHQLKCIKYLRIQPTTVSKMVQHNI